MSDEVRLFDPCDHDNHDECAEFIPAPFTTSGYSEWCACHCHEERLEPSIHHPSYLAALPEQEKSDD